MRPAAASHDNRSWPDSIHSTGASTGVASELRKSRARASAMRNGAGRLSVVNSNLLLLLPPPPCLSLHEPLITCKKRNRWSVLLQDRDVHRAPRPRDVPRESHVHPE